MVVSGEQGLDFALEIFVFEDCVETLNLFGQIPWFLDQNTVESSLEFLNYFSKDTLRHFPFSSGFFSSLDFQLQNTVGVEKKSDKLINSNLLVPEEGKVFDTFP